MKPRFLEKTLSASMLVLMAIAILPAGVVFAGGAADPTPPPPQGELTSDRLEKIWAREQKAYERLGKLFENSDAWIERAQDRIDQASENGKDVTALQAALDAFEAALKKAHPIYESAKGILNSHKGFDANGQVTDPEQARETVRQMGDKLKEIKDALGGTFKTLREVLKSFRDANRPETTN